MIRMYWFDRISNFGDQMSPFIVQSITGCELERVERDATGGRRLLALGSILHEARDGDVIWGSGYHSKHKTWDGRELWRFSNLDVLAVRGPFTKIITKLEVDTFGDPGELLPRYYTPSSTETHEIGLVPHFRDKPDLPDSLKDEFVIDVQLPWRQVVDQITSCKKIVSSSLHGLIIAEAYGIPAIRVRGTELALKYNDYYSLTNRHPSPVDWFFGVTMDSVIPEKDNKRLDQLEDVLKRYADKYYGDT